MPRAPKKPKLHAIQTVDQATVNQADIIVEQLKNLKGILGELEKHPDKLTTPEKIVGAYNIGVCNGILTLASTLIGLETQDNIGVAISGFLDRLKEDDFSGSDCEYIPGISKECETCKGKTLCLLLIEREP
jgi:hypothetical protein